MERAMLGVSCRDIVPSDEIRRTKLNGGQKRGKKVLTDLRKNDLTASTICGRKLDANCYRQTEMEKHQRGIYSEVDENRLIGKKRRRAWNTFSSL